jgi:acyl carrier protein
VHGRILSLVVNAVREIGELNELPLPDTIGRDTALLGEGSLFDSVALVSLVVALEQTLTDEQHVVISLADERAMSQQRSPFQTVGSLADYAERLIQEASDGGVTARQG